MYKRESERKSNRSRTSVDTSDRTITIKSKNCLTMQYNTATLGGLERLLMSLPVEAIDRTEQCKNAQSTG